MLFLTFFYMKHLQERILDFGGAWIKNEWNVWMLTSVVNRMMLNLEDILSEALS